MGDSITVIGKGKVGQSLARGIRELGRTGPYSLAGVLASRTPRFSAIDSEVILIASRDDSIEEVSGKAILAASAKLKLIVQFAGSRSSTSLPLRAGVMRLTLHPIQTFPRASGDLFHGISWMASSEDAAAIRWARIFVKALGGKSVLVLPANALPLYHALTVFSSNFVTLLGGAIEEMSEALGQNPKRMKDAIRPLMEKALRNVLAQPAKDVLTGPIQRGDLETIRKHQRALKAIDPKLRRLYDAFLGYSSDLTGS